MIINQDIRVPYTVSRCIYLDIHIGEKEWWQIICEEHETFWVNKWLSRLRSAQTAKQYAYKLCKFFNFLHSMGISYEFATERHLDAFFTQLRYGKTGGIFVIDNTTSASYPTILVYYYSISEFYYFLSKMNIKIKMQLEIYKSNNKYAFLYNISWDKEKARIYVDKNLEYYKPKIEYIKWYTDEEINAILSNLKRKRDKAIFRLCLCGMRIDEVLSLHLGDYLPKKNCVIPFRSKGKETGNTGRSVFIDIETIRVIEDYLNTERIEVELEYLNKGQVLTDYLFIALNKNDYYGNKMEYKNSLEILKRAAKNAGLDPERIRTHSGRSTSVMEDIIFHTKHPEKLSMEDIRIKYGWKVETSINPYLDSSNPEISRDNKRMLDEVRNEQKKRISQRKKEDNA